MSIGADLGYPSGLYWRPGDSTASGVGSPFSGPPGPWVDVSAPQFGAVSGDITGKSFDAAIAAIQSVYPNGGVNVFIPPGIFYAGIGDGVSKFGYKFTTSVWRFFGMGKGISVIRLVANSNINGTGGITGLFKIDGSASIFGINNFEFSDLTFDGNGYAQAVTPLTNGNLGGGIVAIAVVGRVRDYRLFDCEFINWNEGGFIASKLANDPQIRPTQGVIDRCDFNGNWEGLMTGGADGLLISNSKFLGNSDNGIDGNGGLNINVDNCDLSYNGSPATTYGATVFANEGNGLLMYGNNANSGNFGSHGWSVSNSRFRSNSQGQLGATQSTSRDGIRISDAGHLETTDLLVTNCQSWDDFNLITDTLATTIPAGAIGDVLTQNLFTTPGRWPRWGFLWLQVGTDTFMLQQPALGKQSCTFMRITANGQQLAGVAITGIQCQRNGFARYGTADNVRIENCSLQGNRVNALAIDTTNIGAQAIRAINNEGYNPPPAAAVAYPGSDTPTPVAPTDATFYVVGGTITAVKVGLPTPNRVRFLAQGTGGILANNTAFFYRFTALNAAGETLASVEASITTPAGPNTCSIIVYGTPIVGATSYKFYGRTTGAELLMATIVVPFNTFQPQFTDDGSVAPAGALPAANTTGVATGITAAAAAGAAHSVRIPAGLSLIITSSVNPTLEAFYD